MMESNRPEETTPSQDQSTLLGKILQLAEGQPTIAMEQLEKSGLMRTPRGIAARVHILYRLERVDEAIDLAARVLPILLREELNPLALATYRSLGKARIRLECDPETGHRIGKLLQAQGEFRDAAWCLVRAGEMKGDPQAAEKVYMQVAEEAERAERPEEALALYKYFLRRYPATPLRAFIVSAMEFQELKIRQAQEEAGEFVT